MRSKQLSREAFEVLATKFSALGEVNRLRIVDALQHGERSVNQLAKATGLTQPNVSKHLQTLRSAGLIARRREGVTIRYRLTDDTLLEVCDLICNSFTKKLC